MPELLTALLISVVTNLAALWLWLDMSKAVKQRETHIRFLRGQIEHRNLLIKRLIHEADKSYCSDRNLIDEAQEASE